MTENKTFIENSRAASASLRQKGNILKLLRHVQRSEKQANQLWAKEYEVLIHHLNEAEKCKERIVELMSFINGNDSEILRLPDPDRGEK